MTTTGVTVVEPRVYHEQTPNDWSDRKPVHIPLAEGWDWYQFADRKYSTRWITNGTIFRCTNCGKEVPTKYGVRTHNGKRGIH